MGNLIFFRPRFGNDPPRRLHFRPRYVLCVPGLSDYDDQWDLEGTFPGLSPSEEDRVKKTARPDDLHRLQGKLVRSPEGGHAVLRKNVAVATSEVGLELFVSPYVRLGTSAPIRIPRQEMEMADRIVFRRPVTEVRIARLSGFTICLPTDPAREVEQEQTTQPAGLS